MKINEVKKKFRNTWVLAEVIKEDGLNQPVEVKPIVSSKDRYKLYKKISDLPKGTHIATIFTGEVKGAFLFYVPTKI